MARPREFQCILCGERHQLRIDALLCCNGENDTAGKIQEWHARDIEWPEELGSRYNKKPL